MAVQGAKIPWILNSIWPSFIIFFLRPSMTRDLEKDQPYDMRRNLTFCARSNKILIQLLFLMRCWPTEHRITLQVYIHAIVSLTYYCKNDKEKSCDLKVVQLHCVIFKLHNKTKHLMVQQIFKILFREIKVTFTLRYC